MTYGKFLSAVGLLAGLAMEVHGQTLTLTNGLSTYSSLANTVVNMAGRCELQVTATTNPIPSCTVNLNSPDAWLLLPNIRPSVVSAYYLSQVNVNGSAASAGVNCRVNEYVNGTVIVPQSPGYLPLQVFSAQNFLGPSAQFGLYTYYTNNVGGMSQNVSSFLLKHGYACTFAQNADGTGASQVFIAQESDLAVAVMPTNLDHQCNFVRVFPWSWTGKKGWVGGIGANTALISPLWNYDYDNVATSTVDTEYVPMRDTAYWDDYNNINIKQGSTEALAFNEPDQANQANMSVAAAIGQFPQLMQSGLRVGAPAPSSSGVAGQGLDWLYSFMSEATNMGYRVDFIPVHIYKCSWSTAQFSNYLAGVYQTTGKPVWVTEFNDTDFSSGCSQSQSSEESAITGYIQMMEACPFVERYSIYEYFDPSTYLNLVTTNTPPSLTPVGQAYYAQPSSMAYAQTPGPGGTRGIAQFEFETNALDSSGYGNNGVTFGTPAYMAGHTGRALAFDGANNYVQLPATVARGTSFTFAAWVYWNGGAAWQRIFDFGDNENNYMFLTPNSGSGTLRFAISTNSYNSEQVIETSPLASGRWQHVAVTLSGGTAKLYTNGVLAASASNFTLSPAVFSPVLNYLGKSQYPDPLFSGSLDEVQIADYAMTAAQIAALTTNLPPQFTTNFFAAGSSTQGVAYAASIAGSATDPNPGNSSLTYSKAGGPAWLTVAANGALSGTPPAGFGGTNFFTVRVTDAAGASAFAVLSVFTVTTTASGVWNADASGVWSDATKWSGGIVANAAGYTADFSTINITANRTVTLDTPRSIGNLKFSDTSGAQTWTLISTNGALTLDTASAVVPLIAVTNTVTISAPLAGTNGFEKVGTGTLILSASNSISGNARAGAGTLNLGGSNALQNAVLDLDAGDSGTYTFSGFSVANLGGLAGVRNLTLASGVSLNVSNTAANAFAGVLSGSGGLIKNGPGMLALSSPHIYTGSTVVNGGTLKLSRDPVVKLTFDNVSGSGNGKIVYNSGTGGSAMNGVIITNYGTGASGVSFVPGRVGNALRLAGDGTLIAISNRVASLDGTTAGVNWTLGFWLKTSQAGAGFAYQGDGGWVSGNTAFYLNPGSSAAGTHAGAVRNSGGWLTGNATIDDGNWHYIAIADSGGVKNIYVDGNLDYNSSGWTSASVGGQFWVGGTGDGGDGVAPLSGYLDEVSIYNRSLTQTEVRSLTNTVPGLVTGSYGGQLPPATALSVAAGATFDLGGNSQSVGLLADGAGGGTITNSGAAPVTFSINGGSGPNTFSGVIADEVTNALSLTKNGTGTEILAGVSTYSGLTTVNAGTLLVNGEVGTNTITVNAGTFGGSGVILGPLVVGAGGTLAPGGTGNPGILTCATNVTLAGTTAMELGAAPVTNDELVVAGTLNYGGTLALSTLVGTLAGGETIQLFNATNFTGNFSAISGSPGAGLDWQFNPTNGVLTIYSTVPPLLTASVANGALQLGWPGDHVGWRLLMNTNGLLATNAWFPVAGSAATNQLWLPVDPTQTSVFFQLIYP